MFIFRLIRSLFLIFELIMLARVVFSWLPPHTRQNLFYGFVFEVTEPILAPVRRYLPTFGGMDFSPLVVFFGVEILRNIII